MKHVHDAKTDPPRTIPRLDEVALSAALVRISLGWGSADDQAAVVQAIEILNRVLDGL